MSDRSTLVIVIEESTQVPAGVIYRWYGHGEYNNCHSLLDYIEDNSERLRYKYLEWISDLGNTRHQERLLTDWLALDETLSYWWMTLIAEKSIWKTPEIIDTIRLLALEEIIASLAPKQLILMSRDPVLRSSIQQLCQEQRIPFSWCRAVGDNKYPQRRYGKYRRVPPVVLALAMFVRYVRRYWSLRELRTWNFSEQDNAVLFVTRTRYPETPSNDTPMPHSLLWPDLPTLLEDKGIPSNWLEMLIPERHAPSASRLTQQLYCFHQRYSENEAHVFLGSRFSLRTLAKVFVLYLRLVGIYLRLGGKRMQQNIDNRPWLWQLSIGAWKRSMIGHVAVENLFWFVLFDRVLDDIPPQERGFFLFEGQSWEVAFVAAWKRHGLGELIAVPHSTIRFWDLRCFPDMRDSSERGRYSCPNPDLVAVNGPLARSTLLGAEFPPDRIIECEALRYQHLGVVTRWKPRLREPDQPMRVLMISDYLQAITETMISMAEEALPDLPSGTQIEIKAHPHSVFDAVAMERLQIKVREEPISQLVQDYDMAIVSSGSSAVVDLYVLGLPVIIFQFDDNLDFSPLKGFADLPTVGTSRELVQALMNTEVPVGQPHDVDDIFFLDPSLNRWNSLLNSSPHG